MLIGNPLYQTEEQARQFSQLTYTCLQTTAIRNPEIYTFSTQPHKAGIIVNIRFPTCWDGVNLDSPDHISHIAYPVNGSFESNAPCPASHPVRIPQLFYETIWDTTKFNDKSLWPADGLNPFYWSFGDK